MIGSVKPFCSGMACPIKLQCCRYKAIIDYKHEDHFPFSPYNGATKKCGFYVGTTTDSFIEQIKTLRNGHRTENNSDGEV